MKLAIMQPYFFPYIGYWQLIQSVDVFVIYDDVNYIKGGYINRNKILCQGKEQRFTLEVQGASSNKLINNVKVGGNRRKLLKTIKQCYNKAPLFNDVYPLVENIINNPENNLALFLGHSLELISRFLGIKTRIIYSSSIEKDDSLKGEIKVIDICKRLGANTYINAIGGQSLYKRNNFQEQGIDLNFLQSEIEQYPQDSDCFIPLLSIIDIMMNNYLESIQGMLKNYKLI